MSDEFRYSAWSLAAESIRYLEGDVEFPPHLLDKLHKTLEQLHRQ